VFPYLAHNTPTSGAALKGRCCQILLAHPRRFLISIKTNVSLVQNKIDTSNDVLNGFFFRTSKTPGSKTILQSEHKGKAREIS